MLPYSTDETKLSCHYQVPFTPIQWMLPYNTDETKLSCHYQVPFISIQWMLPYNTDETKLICHYQVPCISIQWMLPYSTDETKLICHYQIPFTSIKVWFADLSDVNSTQTISWPVAEAFYMKHQLWIWKAKHDTIADAVDFHYNLHFSIGNLPAYHWSCLWKTHFTHYISVKFDIAEINSWTS